MQRGSLRKSNCFIKDPDCIYGRAGSGIAVQCTYGPRTNLCLIGAGQGAVNLESWLLPAKCDFDHNGWLCTFLYNSSLKCYQLAAEFGQGRPGRHVRHGKTGGTDRPSQYKSNMPGCPPTAKLGTTPCRTSSP